MKSVTTAMLTFLLASLPSLAHCRTWYVKVDGTGDAPTVRAAIDSAQAGDDVLVGPGTYTWTNQGGGVGHYLISMKSGVWLHSEAGPEVTVLDGEGQGQAWTVVFCSGISQAVVEGFTVAGGVNPGPDGYGGGGVFCGDCDSLEILGNVIVGNMASGVWEGLGGGGVFVGGGDSTTVIADNVITGNYADYIGGGMSIWGSPTVENNIISHNTTDQTGGGIYVYGSAARIIGNTVVANSGSQGSGIYVRSTPTISRNIISDCLEGPAVYCAVDADPTINCNAFWNNEAGDGNCALGSDNFVADPMFCNESEDDYHLHEDSPCAPENSPGACGLVGALPVGCWGAPLSPVGITLIAVAAGAVGALRLTRPRARKRDNRY